MSSLLEFNPPDSPIEPGLTLLEAGAGTGKTYSLVRIMVRHLVEHDIEPKEIVTVTFTRAATAEIKTRLHSLLSEILRELKMPVDKIENDLALKWVQQGAMCMEHARQKISLALASFDSIPIFTIDGFFQRLQKEYAFESGVPFTIELDPDDASFQTAALQDYWRQHVYPLKGNQLQTFTQNISFGAAQKFLSEVMRNQDAILDPAYHQDAQAEADNYHKAWQSFVPVLQEHHQALIDFVNSPPAGINKKKAPFGSRSIKPFFAEVDDILSSIQTPRLKTEKLDNLKASIILSEIAFNKGKFIDLSHEPIAELFHAIECLGQSRPKNLTSSYLGHITRYCSKRIRQLKAERNTQSYNDVTTSLSHTLTSDNAAARSLKKNIHHRFKAALIDEFQDTSPQQCSVFLQLFHQNTTIHEENSARYFHIIGDPKQSIYRFRGADVFSYIAAAKLADHRYNLLTNYRSSPQMIQSVNTLFSYAEDAFLVGDAIRFAPSKWPGQSPSPPLAQNALYLRHSSDEKSNYALIHNDITQQILHLLTTSWQEVDPGANRNSLVEPKDIAILVRSKNEANTLNEMLSEHQVPATLGTRSSLIQSGETQELLTILTALLEPRRSNYLRAALLTPAMGSGSRLESPDEFDAIANDFTDLHELWNQHGLMPMMQQCIERFQIRETLLGLNQGMRRVTNFMHLIELLDSKAREDDLSPLALQQWLSMAKNGSVIDADSEVLELRIATDQAAVQILTQHSSKGLEYPIVFALPSCKTSISNDKLSCSYHHPETGDTHFAPYQDNNHQSLEQRALEEMADAVRLTYVAITRAKFRCYFYLQAAKTKTPEQHAMHRMLGEPDLDQLIGLGESSDSCIDYHDLCTEESTAQTNYTPKTYKKNKTLASRDPLKTQFRTRQRTTSFTGITRNAPDVFHDIDADSQSASTAQTTPSQAVFWEQLQAGASLGLVFHEILEELNFQNTESLEELVEIKLNTYAPWKNRPSDDKRSAIQQDICSYVHQLLDHPIAPNFKLSHLSQSKRLNEAEFLLSGHHFSLHAFSDVLENEPPMHLPTGYLEQLRQLPRQSSQGFLNGIIDLVFEHDGRYHILDWKTNRLNSYDQSSMAKAMADHHYFFQYHLYSLALDHLLQLRFGNHYDPAKQLGNCYYVFLRGIDTNAPDSGVFTDQIPISRLEALRQAFKQTSHTTASVS